MLTLDIDYHRISKLLLYFLCSDKLIEAAKVSWFIVIRVPKIMMSRYTNLVQIRYGMEYKTNRLNAIEITKAVAHR